MNDMLLLPTSDGFTTVGIFSENKKLKEGNAYIYEGLVYIYHGVWKSNSEPIKPGLYTKKSDDEIEYMFIDTPTRKPDKKNVFDVADVKDLSPNAILESVATDPNGFINKEDLEEISIDRDTYIPLIKESDDFLKVGIKKAIIGKQVNVKKRYKDEFENASRLSNMISSLNSSSKMSTTYWADWVAMLGLKWELIIYDGGDERNPLPEEIVLSSDDF